MRAAAQSPVPGKPDVGCWVTAYLTAWIESKLGPFVTCELEQCLRRTHVEKHLQREKTIERVENPWATGVKLVATARMMTGPATALATGANMANPTPESN